MEKEEAATVAAEAKFAMEPISWYYYQVFTL
jgi:hypothetical protein